MASFHSFFLILASILLLGSAEEPFTSTRCDKADRRALIHIFKPFNGPNPAFLSIPCCEWYGVRCDPFSGRVVAITMLGASVPASIPEAIAELPHLREFAIRKNPNLTGSIPQSITKLKNLTMLDLSWNSLSGPIPAFLGQLTSLTFLDLSFNRFSGSIPPSLSMIHNLGALHLDRNQLTGSIPDSFGYFRKSTPPMLFLSHNTLSGPIPATLGIPEWNTIDLSRNNLTGDASFLFGASKKATQMVLSRNILSFDLGKVTFPSNLAVLDLSHNMIYGSIPAQVNQLAGLLVFNVSFNRLCSKIPSGSVTEKFDQYSFFHNKCLCGAPLAACK